jgi:elongator complex protein 1
MDSGATPESAEIAVEHICFLADVNKLYDTALGLYDLELTLLVAQQSQKVGAISTPGLRGRN